MVNLSCFLFLFIFLCSQINTQTFCDSGAGGNLKPCQLRPGESCVSAYFKTPESFDNGTKIRMCANCSYISNLTSLGFIQDVSCNNDNENGFPLAVILKKNAIRGCDTLISLQACSKRTDCYWCDNTLGFNFGVCKSLKGILDPYILPSLIPREICGSITLPPPLEPYFPKHLNRDFLTHFGFKALEYDDSVNKLRDLLSRKVKILNDTYSYCKTQEDLDSWCGFNNFKNNSKDAFEYCIASEKWPHEDYGGWITNTTFTSSLRYHDGFFPMFPSICACKTPGNAYYLPQGRLDYTPQFSSECPREFVLLSFYILLTSISLMALFYLIWDTFLIVRFTCCEDRNFSGKRSANTLIVKVVLIFYVIFTITSQILFIVPSNNNPIHVIAAVALRVTSIIFLLISLCVSLFTYMEIILRSKVFGEFTPLISSLKIIQWSLLMTFVFPLLACFGIVLASCYYLDRMFFSISQNSATLTELAVYLARLGTLVQTFNLILLVLEALITIVATGVLLYVGVIFQQQRTITGKRKFRELIERFAGLIFATFLLVPNVAIQFFLAIFSGWIKIDAVPNPWRFGYETKIGFTWVLWAQMSAEMIWLGLIAYSMRTTVSKSWVYLRFRTLFLVRSLRAQDLSSSSSDLSTDKL